MLKKLLGLNSSTTTATKESLEQGLENFQSEPIVEREVITIICLAIYGFVHINTCGL